MRLTSSILSLPVLLLLIAGCSGGHTPLFTKVSAEETGITFNNLNLESETENIFAYEYFYNGGGVAVGDINNDGLPDLYFSSNNHENKLYLNKGGLKFEDITERSGTACSKGWKTGVCMVDINADGFLDIYVSRSAHANPNGRRNILLINNGDLTFTDKAKEYALDDDSFSTQAAFFDYDRDGDLDAFLLNHSLLSISNSFDISLRNTTDRHPQVGNRLLRNDNNKFVDVSDSVGVFGPASNYGLGVSLSDLNNDGWIDIYAGCDYTGRDHLLLNNRGRNFIDVTDSVLSHISKFTMGTDIADINGDGLMDIYTLDMLPEDNRRQKQLMGADRFDAFTTMVKSGLHAQYMRNMLHVNNGNGTFSEVGQLAGVSNTDWSWSALFADFDNDGVQDLFVSNGFKRDLTDNDFAKYKAFQELVEARQKGQPLKVVDVLSKLKQNKIPNYMYRGSDGLTFSNVTKDWGLDQPLISNGATYADLDNDGDLDLIVNNMNDPAGVYRNNTVGPKHNFIRIGLKGGGKNLFGVGARVEVHAIGKKIVREMLPVRGFQSSVDPVLHFGLGATERIDSVRVFWPSGKVLVVTHPEINQLHWVLESGNTAPSPAPASRQTILKPARPIVFTHRENDYNDFNVQPLLPRMYSTAGPALAVADLNGDRHDDLFVGGALGHEAKIFFGTGDGDFVEAPQHWHPGHVDAEDVDATFFDMDGDGDHDLFVVSGGYEYDPNDRRLRDYLYENEGNGKFSSRDFPIIASSGSCVRPGDADGDGDQDLFIGGRIIPGRYPLAPDSYLLVNDGRGNFSLDKTFESLGMVTDAQWLDVNGDALPDLVLVGEWMNVSILINKGQQLVDETSTYFDEPTSGFWNCLVAKDFDGDGDVDLLAGNQGLNTQMRASPDRPVVLHFADFDENGSIDPLLSYYIQGSLYPYPSRDELTEQLPSFKKRFTTYGAYSDVGIEGVLMPAELGRAQVVSVQCLETSWFENRNGKFVRHAMPQEFQFAPVFSMLARDIDGDGQCDVVAAGNLSATRARSGKMTGNYGTLALGDGRGNFRIVSPMLSGLCVRGDARKIVVADNMVVFGINDDNLTFYDVDFLSR